MSATPSWRARRVLARLSRDRWLPGNEAHAVAVRVCKRLSGAAWGKVMKAAVHDACFVVGMLNGEPAGYPWETGYKTLVDSVHDKKLFGIDGEIHILQHVIRSETNGRTRN